MVKGYTLPYKRGGYKKLGGRGSCVCRMREKRLGMGVRGKFSKSRVPEMSFSYILGGDFSFTLI